MFGTELYGTVENIFTHTLQTTIVMDYNVFPDVPQCFFDTLNKYNWSKVSGAKKASLVSQLQNFLFSKGIATKHRDWSWHGSVPTLRICHDCPNELIGVLNTFDWQTLPVDTVKKMSEDADVYLKLLSGIPRR